MKTLYTPIDLKRTVAFRRLTRYQLETSTQASAIGLLGSREQYSTLTITIRCMALLLKRLTVRFPERTGGTIDATGIKGSDILSDILKVGKAMGIIAEALTQWTIAARTKIQEGMVSREAAATAVKELIEKTGEIEFDDRELYDLLTFAAPGAGPSRTERETLIVSAGFVRLAHAYAIADDTGPMAAAARIALTNLLAWMNHGLHERPTSPQVLMTGVQEAMLKIRVETIRTMSGYIIGAAVSAATQVTRHYLSWLNDPWAKAASFAEVADRLDRAIEIFEQRTPAVGPYTQLASLSAGDIYDSEIVQFPGLTPFFAKRPTTALALSTSPTQRPLAADFQYGLRFSQEAMTTWVNSAWVLIRHAQELATNLKALALDTIGSIAVEDRAPIIRGDAGIVGVGLLSAYPLVSRWDPNYYWPTNQWSIRAIGIEAHVQYTREKIRLLMEKYPDVPVRVTGTPHEIPLDVRPTVLPSFDQIDGAMLYMDKSLQSLTQIWNMTVPQFQMWISTFGDSAADLTWRALAEALRFVGRISINDTLVDPYARHWFHGREFADEVFDPADKAIELLNTRAGEGPAATGVRVVLRTFAFVPESARIARIPDDLTLVRTEIDNTNLPLIQWITQATAIRASKIAIRGWLYGEEYLDIVLINSATPYLDNFITGMTDVGPFTTRPFNVIVEGTDPVDAAAPPAVAPPVGAFSYIDM